MLQIVEIRILGPLEILDSEGSVMTRPNGRGRQGAVNIPSEPKVQSTLVILALNVGNVVSVERLMDVAWGPEPGMAGRTKNGVQKNITALRDILQAHSQTRIETSTDGYKMQLGADTKVDYDEFCALRNSAQLASSPQARIELIHAALKLWRGDPPAALTQTQDGRSVWAGLRGERVSAELLQILALKDLKGLGPCLQRLSHLTAEYPEDEHFLSLYMQALVEVGRSTEAIKAFENYEDRIDGHGLQPATEVQNLYRSIKARRPGRRVENPQEEETASEITLVDYLSRVVRASTRLRFGEITAEYPENPNAQGTMTLERVWTPLQVSLPPAETDRLDSRTDESDVLAALGHKDHHRVIILGKPGAGKSTVVSYRTFRLALDAVENDDAGIVPIHVRLPSLKPVADSASVMDIWPGVYEAINDGLIDRALTAQLTQRLREGTAAILFDGLDEVQEELISGVLSVINTCAATFKRSQVTVTCRTFDYLSDSPKRRLPFPVIELLPFDLDRQLLYIENWYKGLSPYESNERLMQRKANLQQTLKDTPSLIEMGQTPLLLALMTLVHTQDGELPAARAILYRRTISYLLAETAVWRERSAQGSTVASQDMLLFAARVAFEYHKSQETLPTEFRGMSEPELRNIATEHFRLYDTKLGTKAREAALLKVEGHLQRLIQGNGLLLEQGGGKYDFAFKQYREFLAGLYLNSILDDQDAMELAVRPHWHECFQLLASHEGGSATNISSLLHFILDLGDEGRQDPPFGPSDVVLAAEMLHEIGREKLLSLNQARVLERSIGRGTTGLWLRTASNLLPLITDSERWPHVTPMSRIRAASAIGWLGDLRFVDADGTALPPTERIVRFSAGSFLVGDSRKPVSGRRKLDEASTAPRTVITSGFSIAKYAVTNSEFCEFVEDRGYENSRWWTTPEAELWRTGDPEFIGSLQDLWLATAEENYERELQEGYYTLAELEKTAVDLCKPRVAPFFSANTRFNAPNQPVVGINFWEARAYCEWLTHRGHSQGWLDRHLEVRLPSEFEWERSTRRDSEELRYPWGNDWDPVKARTRHDGTNMTQASPVGCYPSGSWQGGPMDLAGNVWEWTASRLLGYEPAFDHRRNDPEGLMPRAIRGSSWYDRDAVEHSRCTSRFIDLPGNVYFDLGFRITISEIVPGKHHGRSGEALEQP